jgi:hypothetical protein
MLGLAGVILLGVNPGVKTFPFDEEYRRYFGH